MCVATYQTGEVFNNDDDYVVPTSAIIMEVIYYFAVTHKFLHIYTHTYSTWKIQSSYKTCIHTVKSAYQKA